MLFLVVYAFVKFGGRGQQQGESGFLSFIPGTNPAFLKSSFVNRILPFGGIGNIECVIFSCFRKNLPFLFDAIQYYKMILVPMKNTRPWDILNQLLKVDTYSLCPHADTFGSIADTKHGYSLTGNETSFSQILKRIAATVVFGNHPQA